MTITHRDTPLTDAERATVRVSTVYSGPDRLAAGTCRVELSYRDAGEDCWIPFVRLDCGRGHDGYSDLSNLLRVIGLTSEQRRAQLAKARELRSHAEDGQRRAMARNG